jgi:hypothetical protein
MKTKLIVGNRNNRAIAKELVGRRPHHISLVAKNDKGNQN